MKKSAPSLFDITTEESKPEPKKKTSPNLLYENSLARQEISVPRPLCPTCGGETIDVLRPRDHDGHTLRCIGRCEAYFTPKTGQEFVKKAFDAVSQETLREIDATLGTNVARDDEPRNPAVQPPLFAELSGPMPPREFPEFDENIEIDHSCASCGYAWSGGEKTDDDLGDPGAKECPRCGASWMPPDEHAGQEKMF